MGDEAKPVLKIKHDWYQTEPHVIVTILLKKAEEDKIEVKYGTQTLLVTGPIPASETLYNLDITLAHEIEPSGCTYRVLPSKIEIKLQKKQPGQWTALEATAEVKKDLAKYPSSSRNQKNWDKLEKDIEKEDAAEKKGQDALTDLFQKIYGEGSDDVRRAMNKSFVESAGTVLSTNWNEVSKDNVQVKAPEGVEFKKWN